jgi:hypothetical protein
VASTRDWRSVLGALVIPLLGGPGCGPSCPPLSDPWVLARSISSAEAKATPPCSLASCDESSLKPRCSSMDATCGPEFVDSKWPDLGWRGPHGESGDQCYRPDARRYPTAWGSAVMTDRCDYDGECLMTGCGLCLSYRRGPQMCQRSLVQRDLGQPSPPGWPVWCGCVDHRCTTFRE